jgi:hypothetical protein
MDLNRLFPMPPVAPGAIHGLTNFVVFWKYISSHKLTYKINDPERIKP